MTKVVNPIHTPCKKCTFAKYENKTQIACSLDYLNIYRNKNIEILEAYDEELEFYVINNKKCIGYREEKWFDSLGMSHTTLDQKINKYNELNKIDYALAIDTKDMSVEDFDNSIKNISELKLQPQKLIVIRHIGYDTQLHYSKIEFIFNKYLITNIWKIKTVLDTELSRGDILHQIINDNSDCRFISYTSDYKANLDKLINTANNIVYHNLDQFNILTLEDEAKTIIFSTGVYRYSNSLGISILENKDNYTVI